MLKLLNYNFHPSHLTMLRGQSKVFLDDYAFSPSFRLISSDGFPVINLDDLMMLFSPALRREGDDLIGPAGSASLNGVRQFSGEKLGDLLHATLGMTSRRGENAVVFCCEEQAESAFLPVEEERVQKLLFWFSKGSRLVPYQLIVPETISDSTSLLVLLHGGGGDPGSCLDDFGGTLPLYADKYNCILVCADSYMRNSTFGCPIPPQGILPESMDMFPGSREDLEGRLLSEDALLSLILYCRDRFSISPRRIFMAGNSMGGMGSFYFAARHRDLIRAIAPAGAAPSIDRFDYAALSGMPVFFTGGTDDHHGYSHLKKAAEHMRSLGLELVFRTVEGGSHQYAWVQDADEWFSFLFNRK